MSHRLNNFSLACALVALAAAAGLTASNVASAADSHKAVEKRFKQESVACIQMKDRDAEQACKKEALAARAEAQNDRLTEPGADFAANAQARCKGLPQPEQKNCLARVQGQGVQSGSVASGGVLRELTVPVAPGAASGATRH
ncbi:MAG: hypothetical protein M3Y32_07170 [Pseudomonadota bacterium]|nr:hypothetical protein [Pseudomonadota bacterium]